MCVRAHIPSQVFTDIKIQSLLCATHCGLPSTQRITLVLFKTERGGGVFPLWPWPHLPQSPGVRCIPHHPQVTWEDPGQLRFSEHASKGQIRGRAAKPQPSASVPRLRSRGLLHTCPQTSGSRRTSAQGAPQAGAGLSSPAPGLAWGGR